MISQRLLNTLMLPKNWTKHRRHTCVIITAEIDGDRYLYVKDYPRPAIGAWHTHQAHQMLDAGKLPHSTVTVLHKSPAQLVIALQRDYSTHHTFYSLPEYQKALKMRLSELRKKVD